MTSDYAVSREQMEAFAELGYIVLPQVLPRSVIESTIRVIDDLRQREPPPRQGHHAYWLQVTPPDHSFPCFWIRQPFRSSSH